MKRLIIILIPLLILALTLGEIGCSGGSEVDGTASTERQQIIQFLEDNLEVIAETRDIFEDWSYEVKIIENIVGSNPYDTWVKQWERRNAFASRVTPNLNHISSINPPEILAEYWHKMEDAINYLWEYFYRKGQVPELIWVGLSDKASAKYFEAWLDLDNICRSHDIDVRSDYPRIVP